jgi:hypothetical protein
MTSYQDIAVGLLVKFACKKEVALRVAREDKGFQKLFEREGIELG